MRYEIEVDIKADAEHVWGVLHDVVTWPDWSPTMDEVRLLDDGPFGVGSKARVKQPKMNPMVWTVTESDPGTGFTWRTGNPGYTITAGHELAVVDGGTKVRLTLEIGGVFAPILAVLAGARVRGYVDLEGENLKRRCEA